MTHATPGTRTDLLTPLAGESQVLLNTRKRDGTWVGTPVNLAVEGDHAFFRTWSTSGKAKRLHNSSGVEVAPCTRRGRVTGPWISGRARWVTGATERHARTLIEAKHPILQRLFVRGWHRLRGLRTEHYLVDDVRAISRHSQSTRSR
jgi:uncharacterized protein